MAPAAKLLVAETNAPISILKSGFDESPVYYNHMKLISVTEPEVEAYPFIPTSLSLNQAGLAVYDAVV